MFHCAAAEPKAFLGTPRFTRIAYLLEEAPMHQPAKNLAILLLCPYLAQKRHRKSPVRLPVEELHKGMLTAATIGGLYQTSRGRNNVHRYKPRRGCILMRLSRYRNYWGISHGCRFVQSICTVSLSLYVHVCLCYCL